MLVDLATRPLVAAAEAVSDSAASSRGPGADHRAAGVGGRGGARRCARRRREPDDRRPSRPAGGCPAGRCPAGRPAGRGRPAGYPPAGQPEEAGGEPGDTPRTEMEPRDISPRALLLQVRSLEATLAEEDQRLDGVRRDAFSRAEEQVRREQSRVRVTLRVMRDVVAGQPGDVAAGRIEAALDRLGADPLRATPAVVRAPDGLGGHVRADVGAGGTRCLRPRPGRCPRTCRRRTG